MKAVALLTLTLVFASGCTGVEFTPPPTTQDAIAEDAYLSALDSRGPGWRDLPDSELLYDGHQWCAMVGSRGWDDTVRGYYESALVEMDGDQQAAELITLVGEMLGWEAVLNLCPRYVGELPAD